MPARLRLAQFRYPTLIIVGLVICALMVDAVGLLIPTSSRQKNLSRPFPCQDSPCGCMSADDCWNNCCCHTRDERIAWAAAHCVLPPSPQVETGQSAKESCACCVPAETDQVTTETSTATGGRIIIGIFNRYCKGGGFYCLDWGPGLPVSARVELPHYLPCIGHVSTGPVTLCSISQGPPDPPPRCV